MAKLLPRGDIAAVAAAAAARYTKVVASSGGLDDDDGLGEDEEDGCFCGCGFSPSAASSKSGFQSMPSCPGGPSGGAPARQAVGELITDMISDFPRPPFPALL